MSEGGIPEASSRTVKRSVSESSIGKTSSETLCRFITHRSILPGRIDHTGWNIADPEVQVAVIRCSKKMAGGNVGIAGNIPGKRISECAGKPYPAAAIVIMKTKTVRA